MTFGCECGNVHMEHKEHRDFPKTKNKENYKWVTYR